MFWVEIRPPLLTSSPDSAPTAEPTLFPPDSVRSFNFGPCWEELGLPSLRPWGGSVVRRAAHATPAAPAAPPFALTPTTSAPRSSPHPLPSAYTLRWDPVSRSVPRSAGSCFPQEYQTKFFVFIFSPAPFPCAAALQLPQTLAAPYLFADFLQVALAVIVFFH